MKRITAFTAMACPAAVLATAKPADAALFYEFTFTGEVIQALGDNPDHPWGGVGVGDEVFFSYVIDVEQEDANPSFVFGEYEVSDVTLGFGGITFHPQNFGPLVVALSLPGGIQEAEIEYENNVVPGYPNDGGAFQLAGFSVFEDDSIPIDFELESFILDHGVSYGAGPGGGMALISLFDAYSYQVVPGPASFLLLPGLLLSRRRRDR